MARAEVLTVAQTVAHAVSHWIFNLGALGLIPLGLLDSSVVPLPGSMDVLTIVLASRVKQWPWWFFYAGMATFGSVLGAYFTYRLGLKGGEKALEKKISARRLKKVRRIFRRWGFAAIAIPALLPPPIPLVPFVLVAGAMKYGVRKFLAALALGRMARYSILAVLAGIYGRAILHFLTAHPGWVIGVVSAVVAAGAAAYLLFREQKRTTK